MKQLKFKRLSSRAILPKYATTGAACFDLHALLHEGEKKIVNLSKPAVFDTGLAVEVPENHVMLIFSRSGHGFNNNIRLSNCVGVIDSDYRGEIKVKLASDSPTGTHFIVSKGDRIAQAMILPVEQYEIVEAEMLTSTDRGEGGFGSTGK